jgi:hypothetical protein
LKDPLGYVLFRWTVPTVMHLTCTAIAAWGMVKIWREQTERGRTVDLDAAFPHFAAAMALHGVYNLAAAGADEWLFPQA